MTLELRLLRNEIAALRSALAEREAECERLRADAARLNWLQENAYQLSTTDQGETCDARWEVFPNAVDLDEDTDVPSGQGIRAAIDAAMSAAVAPAARERDKGTAGPYTQVREDTGIAVGRACAAASSTPIPFQEDEWVCESCGRRTFGIDRCGWCGVAPAARETQETNDE